jgi:hypothetical protein
MSVTTGRPFDEDVLINQIGKMNVYAISGGRVYVSKNQDGETVGIDLPCGAGYRVSIELGWNDEWVVTRQFVRKGIVFNKGTVEGVLCENIGEVAYRAACFRSYDFGKVSA